MFKTPFLQFDFLNLNTKQREQTIFNNPIKIYQTNDMSEVINVLKDIELAVDKGYYAAGFLSYESSEAFLAVDSFQKNDFPLIWFGIFKEPINKTPEINKNFDVGKWTPNISKQAYKNAFKKIECAFDLKQTKQVNYTLQLDAPFNGDSYAYYNALKREQKADYSCYFSLDQYDILSLSPELFFDLDKNILTVKPMKGTKERGKSSLEDELFKNELKNSTKDKLENKLIVDLMVEELKSISIQNSINIKQLYEISTFPTLFQMTSTIQSIVRPSVSLTNIFKALFPCGSITGTPKIETINFINKLENRNRQVYCGAMGFITPEKKATFNVPIRTVSIDQSKNTARYDVGGGITSLSNANDEYNEAFTKAKVLNVNNVEFELIETFGLHQGKYIAYNEHLNRLQSSANYFNFKLDLNTIDNDLSQLQKKFPNQNLRVRLTLKSNGHYLLSHTPLILDEAIQEVKIANKPINKNNLFLYHKTTNRSFYNELKADFENIFDVILWNEENEVTEFTIGNIVIEYNNKLITPPIESGLLPGTYREVLLANKQIEEQVITLDMLNKANHIWLINSLRKWVKVNIKK